MPMAEPVRIHVMRREATNFNRNDPENSNSAKLMTVLKNG